jgi:sugar phosphate isomerase/epimerase
LDPEQRRQAVAWTRRTLEAAEDLEAGVVVLHCGHVDMDPETETLHAFQRADAMDTARARDFSNRKKTELAAKKPRHLDRLLFSLDRLVEEARRRRVTLGLENRYHYHQLPGTDDFARVFAEFDGAPVGYWHDTGHCRALELLGFSTEGEMPGRYADRLVGVHLHDAVGLDDHLPPGTGNLDFAALLPHLLPETLQVMELKPGTPETGVLEGMDVLRKRGFGG